MGTCAISQLEVYRDIPEDLNEKLDPVCNSFEKYQPEGVYVELKTQSAIWIIMKYQGQHKDTDMQFLLGNPSICLWI